MKLKKHLLDFDLIIQSLLIILFLILLVTHTSVILLLIFLFVIGFWQFFGSILYAIFSDPTPRKNYFLAASAILFSFIIIVLLSEERDPFAWFFFVCPVILAIWYYVITFREMTKAWVLDNSSEN